MIDLTEEQEKELGKRLVSLFRIRRLAGSVDRYQLGEGHNDKTQLGIARTVVSLIQEIQNK